MTTPGFESLPGTALPEGLFTINDDDERRVAHVVGAHPTGSDDAHPLWAYIATQRGIGISVADICKLADFDVNDGPMLGSSHLEYHAPLRPGVNYRVTGEVLGMERKRGSSGSFDVLEFREELHAPDGQTVCASTSTYILPRRDQS